MAASLRVRIYRSAQAAWSQNQHGPQEYDVIFVEIFCEQFGTYDAEEYEYFISRK